MYRNYVLHSVLGTSHKQAEFIAHGREVRGTLPPLVLPSSIPAQAAPSLGRGGAPVFGGWSAKAAVLQVSSGVVVTGVSRAGYSAAQAETRRDAAGRG